MQFNVLFDDRKTLPITRQPAGALFFVELIMKLTRLVAIATFALVPLVLTFRLCTTTADSLAATWT